MGTPEIEGEEKFERRPAVRRGAVPLSEVSGHVKHFLPKKDVAWRPLLDFVDDFRGSTTAGKRWLVADEPPTTGDARFDAAPISFARHGVFVNERAFDRV